MHILTESLIIYKDHLIPLGSFQQWVDKSKGREHTITEGVSPESGDSIEYENTVSWEDYYGTEPFYNELDSYIKTVPIAKKAIYDAVYRDSHTLAMQYCDLCNEKEKYVQMCLDGSNGVSISDASLQVSEYSKRIMELYTLHGLLIQKLQLFHEKLI